MDDTASQISRFSPRFQGQCFENMLETLTRGFGPFEAWRSGRNEPFVWSSDFWFSGEVSLVSSSFSASWDARTICETPECLAIIVPRDGAIGMDLRGQEIEGAAGNLLLVNNREPQRVSICAAPHKSDTLNLDWKILSQAVTATLDVPLINPLQIMPLVDVFTPAGRLLASLVETIVIGMRHDGPLLHSPIAMSNLTQALADLIVRSVPHGLSHLLDRKIYRISPRHVRAAMEFMQENIGRPITMHLVAQASGVSIRALELGFREFKDTTPSAYLKTIRLRAVRQQLLDPFNNESLREICLKWGFAHFGRFASLYSTSYGEKPSETRKRVRSMSRIY